MFAPRVSLLVVAVVVALTSASPLPGSQRDPDTGRKIGSVSSANNTGLTNPKTTTVNNVDIFGVEGARAACDRGLTDWCPPPPKRDFDDDLDDALALLKEVAEGLNNPYVAARDE